MQIERNDRPHLLLMRLRIHEILIKASWSNMILKVDIEIVSPVDKPLRRLSQNNVDSTHNL